MKELILAHLFPLHLDRIRLEMVVSAVAFGTKRVRFTSINLKTTINAFAIHIEQMPIVLV